MELLISVNLRGGEGLISNPSALVFAGYSGHIGINRCFPRYSPRVGNAILYELACHRQVDFSKRLGLRYSKYGHIFDERMRPQSRCRFELVAVNVAVKRDKSAVRYLPEPADLNMISVVPLA